MFSQGYGGLPMNAMEALRATHAGNARDARDVLAPVVKPAFRRGWRDLNTVQFGMAPAHAMTLGPMDSATGSFLDLLDGTRGLPLLREEGRRMDLPDGYVDTLVSRLVGAGLLDDAKGGGPAADALRGKK
jgi:hypothetical protein